MEDNTLEILTILEQITEITFRIQIVYSNLTLLEVSKDITSDYNNKKKDLLDSLSLLLKEEENAYEPFENNYELVNKALEIFYKNIKFNVPEKIILIQKRIQEKLETIKSNIGLTYEIDEELESYLEQEYYTNLFFDENYSLTDLIPVIRFFKNFDYLLDTYYISLLNNSINEENDYHRLLINAKLNYLFEAANDLEQNALNNGFDSITINNLNQNEIDQNLIERYIETNIIDKINDLLAIFSSATNIDMVISEIYSFKAYLLCLNTKQIKELKDKITNYNFQNKELKSIILDSINSIKLPTINKNNYQL